MIELLLLGAAGAVVILLLNNGTRTPQPPRPVQAGAAQSRYYRYRSRHIRHPFVFNLVRQPDGEVRIYIVNSPSYRSRPTDGHSTHRYLDQFDRYYVCVDHSLRPTNFHDARSWARYWADKTAQYMRTRAPLLMRNTMRKLIKASHSTPVTHASLSVEITESAQRGIMDTIGRHPPERFRDSWRLAR